MSHPQIATHSAGLGLRRELLDDILLHPPALDFLEVAPENWLSLSGSLQKKFATIAERYPVFLHGLSLNLGGQAALDIDLIDAIGSFIKTHNCPVYSEHLSWCADDGHLYDLLPIPFTGEAVKHVSTRIRQVQDRLGQRIAIENASYYLTLANDLSELEFISAVVSEADCDLLLDINNIVVNSINHRYNASAFLRGLPLDRVRYLHIAGHYVEAEDLRVDTHGSNVIDPVWELLKESYKLLGARPTLLERDFNIPPLAELMQEVDKIRHLQKESGVENLA